MKKIIYLTLAISVSSCSPNFYIPNAQHVPGFTEQGEKKISGQVFVDPALEIYGVDVQYARAVGQQQAFLINAAAYSSSPSRGNTTIDGWMDFDLYEDFGGSGQGIEIGYGYFKKVKHVHSFEVYGFGGIGGFSNNTSYGDDGGFKGNMIKFSVQPSYTATSKLIDCALSSRLTSLYYFNIRGHFEHYEKLLNHKNNFFFVEPALTLRIGRKNVKFQLQYQHSIILNQNKTIRFAYIPVNFGAGIVLKI